MYKRTRRRRTRLLTEVFKGAGEKDATQAMREAKTASFMIDTYKCYCWKRSENGAMVRKVHDKRLGGNYCTQTVEDNFS